MQVESSLDVRPFLAMHQPIPPATPLRETSELQHVGVAAEETLVGVVKGGNDLAYDLASLIVELVGRRAEHRLEDGDQLGAKLLDGRLVALVCIWLAKNDRDFKNGDSQSLRMHS